MTPVAGAVLAAGSGTRMGGPKAELVVGGQRLVDRAVATLTAAGCRPVFAVVAPGVDVPNSRAVVNSDPARGMRSSLELAVAAAGAAPALLVVLVDMPGLRADAVRQVAAAWRPGRVSVGRYGGRTGHPIVMSPTLWRTAVAAAAPDEGARALLRARCELVDLVDVPGDPGDLDTPGDVAAWLARTAPEPEPEPEPEPDDRLA
jgi:molybdenum cofactor cytidylyltransferase/nicotine blue oxidoreductase